MEVKDFIEDKGLPEMSLELLCDYLNDDRYRNPLRNQPHKRASENIAAYEYYDPTDKIAKYEP